MRKWEEEEEEGEGRNGFFEVRKMEEMGKKGSFIREISVCSES